MPSGTETRQQTKQGRFYDIPDVGRYPSVTTILSCISKPALMNWAAKVEREMVIAVSTELYQQAPDKPKMTPAQWQMSLNNRLGTAKASQKELARAGEIGTQLHALIEWTLKGELCYECGPSPKISDKAQWAHMAWEDWRRSVKLKPIHVEQVVYSQKYGYAGTMDLVCEVEVWGLIRYFEERKKQVPNGLRELAQRKNWLTAVPDWKTGKAVYPEAHLQNAAYRQAIREMGHCDPDIGLIVRLPKVYEDPEFEVVIADEESQAFETFLSVMELWKWQYQNDLAYETSKAKTPIVPLEQQLKASLEAR